MSITLSLSTSRRRSWAMVAGRRWLQSKEALQAVRPAYLQAVAAIVESGRRSKAWCRRGSTEPPEGLIRALAQPEASSGTLFQRVAVRPAHESVSPPLAVMARVPPSSSFRRLITRPTRPGHFLNTRSHTKKREKLHRRRRGRASPFQNDDVCAQSSLRSC